MGGALHQSDFDPAGCQPQTQATPGWCLSHPRRWAWCRHKAEVPALGVTSQLRRTLPDKGAALISMMLLLMTWSPLNFKGVQSAAVNVICELARRNPKNYLSLAPLFFKLMTSSTNNWVLIKIIKLASSPPILPFSHRVGTP